MVFPCHIVKPTRAHIFRHKSVLLLSEVDLTPAMSTNFTNTFVYEPIPVHDIPARVNRVKCTSWGYGDVSL